MKEGLGRVKRVRAIEKRREEEAGGRREKKEGREGGPVKVIEKKVRKGGREKE
jgi:hypothetical protein